MSLEDIRVITECDIVYLQALKDELHDPAQYQFKEELQVSIDTDNSVLNLLDELEWFRNCMSRIEAVVECPSRLYNLMITLKDEYDKLSKGDQHYE